MKRKTLSLLVAGSLACGAQFAMAQQQQSAGERFADQLYFGAGATWNSLDGFDDALGMQVLAGWNPDFSIGQIDTAVEVGFMSSGDFEAEGVGGGPEADAQGLWATAVGTIPIAQDWHAIGRVGADFGDDDGPMFGAGVGYEATPAVDVRGEYVLRDEIDSLQLNVIWRPYSY